MAAPYCLTICRTYAKGKRTNHLAPVCLPQRHDPMLTSYRSSVDSRPSLLASRLVGRRKEIRRRIRVARPESAKGVVVHQARRTRPSQTQGVPLGEVESGKLIVLRRLGKRLVGGSGSQEL